MKRLAIVVEGPTEQTFVAEVLAGPLRPLRVDATPVLIGRTSGGKGGGSVNVPRLATTISGLYWSFDVVTSLVDFYGFQRKGDAAADTLEKTIRNEVAARIKHNWDERRVFPYIQRHEFEALLFADVGAFANIDTPQESIDELRVVSARFATPEDINDDPATAPSKRICQIVPNYNKVLHGNAVAGEIGLEKMRSACPRFRAWLARLEALSSG